MSDVDPIRLAKLLEMAGHPSSNEGEALNSLRAARSLLARGGKSLRDLAVGDGQASSQGGSQAELKRLAAEIAKLNTDLQRLRSDNARLRRENARIESLQAELEMLKDAGPDPSTPRDEGETAVAPARITDGLIAVFDLLADWRSVADLMEKLGPGLSLNGVKKIVRLLDDKGLLRSVESWPTRYRLRFEGELGEEAKAFRSRIEDARAAISPPVR